MSEDKQERQEIRILSVEEIMGCNKSRQSVRPGKTEAVVGAMVSGSEVNANGHLRKSDLAQEKLAAAARVTDEERQALVSSSAAGPGNASELMAAVVEANKRGRLTQSDGGVPRFDVDRDIQAVERKITAGKRGAPAGRRSLATGSRKVEPVRGDIQTVAAQQAQVRGPRFALMASHKIICEIVNRDILQMCGVAV